jgi:antibiotic biosynthesis monooxygenase (ABM) superfamily enzyme
MVEALQPRRMVIAKQDELASAIITDSIAPERKDEYLQWVRGINRAAESFEGYRETNVFPPLRPEGREWITIIHFQTRPDLENWLSSPVRGEWVDRFRRDFGDFAIHRI